MQYPDGGRPRQRRAQPGRVPARPGPAHVPGRPTADIVALRRSRRQEPRTSRKAMLLGFAGLAIMGPITLVLAMLAYYSTQYVPIEDVMVERPAGITRVYDRSGAVELGVLNNPGAPLAEPVELDEVAPEMIVATVSTEDEDFWDHPGVNVRGLLRAVRDNIEAGGFGSGTGGSSITQQLVKNVYICPSFSSAEDPCVAERTVERKLREMSFALFVEMDASKEEILTWYLNQISYGDRYIGVQAASRGYFRKPASELTLGEAALLAGIPAAPTAYHPRLNCSRDVSGECARDEQGRTIVSGAARARQHHVLDLMAQRGLITPEEATATKNDLVMVYPRAAIEAQRAPVFIETQVEPRLVRLCEAGELPMLRGADDCAASVSSGGWTVVTTLDWQRTQEAQQMVRESIAQGLAEGCNCYNGAVVTIDPASGQVLVYVPNSDRDSTDPRVGGHIDQLVEINQPGSALKPAVYLTWFDQLHRTPANILWDTSPLVLDPEEDVVEEGTEIVNPRPDGAGEGLITARSALGGSQNVPAFRAAQEAGVDNVISMAKRLGITTLDQGFDPTFRDHESVQYGPTIATGGANIRAIDMAYMMATIGNMGAMVGLPHHATYVDDIDDFQSRTDEGHAAEAEQQFHLFQRGHLRLPDTRSLDPVVVLKVLDSEGNVIYEAPPPERVQVVDPGSAWLLHSILSDCTARWLIWSCGWSNQDTSLDVFVAGERLPAGVKTGTQQGPESRDDVLASWVIGYSRHAATAVWIGNANRELIRDGPAVGFASGHTALRIYKGWMARHHALLLEQGVNVFPGFDDLQPPTVAYGPFPSPATERGLQGGCSQELDTWFRTDIEYEPDCDDGLVKLPDYKRQAAIDVARRMGIPIDGFPVLVREPDEDPTPTPTATPTAEPAEETPTPSATQPIETPTVTPEPSPTVPTPADETPTSEPQESSPTPDQGPNRGSDDEDDEDEDE